MLNIRVTSRLKDDASKVFDEIGISMPEAIRVFLNRVVRDQRFPFELEVPNAVTVAAFREAREGKTQRFATVEELFDALEKGGR